MKLFFQQSVCCFWQWWLIATVNLVDSLKVCLVSVDQKKKPNSFNIVTTPLPPTTGNSAKSPARQGQINDHNLACGRLEL